MVLGAYLAPLSSLCPLHLPPCLSVSTSLLSEPVEPDVHLATSMHTRADLASTPCSHTSSIVPRWLRMMVCRSLLMSRSETLRATIGPQTKDLMRN